MLTAQSVAVGKEISVPRMDLSHEETQQRKTEAVRAAGGGGGGYDFFDSLSQAVANVAMHHTMATSDGIKRETEYFHEGGMIQPPDPRMEVPFPNPNFPHHHHAHHQDPKTVQNNNCQLCVSASFGQQGPQDVGQQGQVDRAQYPMAQKSAPDAGPSDCAKKQTEGPNNAEGGGSNNKSGSEQVFDSEKHNCKVCGKFIRHEHNLNRHMLIHGAVKTYQCSQCPKNFRRQDHLRVHIKSCHASGRYKDSSAPTFSISFRKADTIPHYSKKKHSPKKQQQPQQQQQQPTNPANNAPSTIKTPFVCQVCSKSLSSLSNLQRHHLIHTNIKPFPCSSCSKCFRQKVQLDKHFHSVHKNELPQMKALSVMERGLHPVSAKGMSSGSSKQGEQNNNPISCKYIYVCEVCRKPLSSIHSLMRHKLIHFNIKPYQCTECPRHFKRKDHLCVHVNSCHTEGGQQMKPCDGLLVPSMGPSEKLLMMGAEDDKSDEAKYVCEICSKAYRYRSGIDRHKLIHENVKPFQCSHCPKGFRRKDHLFNHIKSCHKDAQLPSL